MDSYLLFGFGQCYAAFYKGEHPEAALDPMTEYRELFDEKFGRPTTFLGAIRNNPREAFRYFARNTLHNLRLIRLVMLETRQKEGPKSELIDRVPKLFLLTGLLTGGTLLTRRIFVAGRGPKRTPFDFCPNCGYNLQAAPIPLTWKESVRRFFSRNTGTCCGRSCWSRCSPPRLQSRSSFSSRSHDIGSRVCTTGLLNCRRVRRFPAAAGIPEKTAMVVMDAGTHPFLPPAFSWPRVQPKFRGQCTTANRPRLPENPVLAGNATDSSHIRPTPFAVTPSQ